MAQGRKSFIIHIDSLGILDELSDEQAGQLFKLIAEYHNPNKPKQTQITQLVNLAFYPFKSQFERDLQTYGNVVERNKKNGLSGGRPKNKNPKKPKKADSDSDNKNDSKRLVLFKNSLIFDRVEFKKAMPEDWDKERLLYYYESALAWSGEGKKKIDWVATIKAWARRDEKEGKIKFTNNNYVPLQGTLE